MTAIKNMTLDQLLAEGDRIDVEISKCKRALNACRARWDAKTVLLDGWRKRMNAIASRLLEIARGATPEPGEVDSLFALQDKLFARYELRTRDRREISLEMNAIDKPMAALYRRSSRVQDRINRLRSEARAA